MRQYQHPLLARAPFPLSRRKLCLDSSSFGLTLYELCLCPPLSDLSSHPPSAPSMGTPCRMGQYRVTNYDSYAPPRAHTEGVCRSTTRRREPASGGIRCTRTPGAEDTVSDGASRTSHSTSSYSNHHPVARRDVRLLSWGG